MGMERLYSPHEIAAALSVSNQTVQREIEYALLPQAQS